MGLWHDPLAVTLLCGGLLAAAYALNHVFSPRSGAVALTIMLIMLWCAEMAIHFVPSPPGPTWLLAGMDLIGFLGAWTCWRQAPRAWKEALAVSFVLAMVVQVARGLAVVLDPVTFGPHTPGADTFTAARNVLFFTQVVCCAWVGGNRAVAWVLSHLPSHRAVGDRLGSRR